MTASLSSHKSQVSMLPARLHLITPRSLFRSSLALVRESGMPSCPDVLRLDNKRQHQAGNL